MPYTPLLGDDELIEAAANEIELTAATLRESSTVPPEHTDWRGGQEAMEEHARLVQQVAVLREFAERLRGGPPPWPFPTA